MKVTLRWSDGDSKRLNDVLRFRKHWHVDEYVVEVWFQDGSTDTYTGRELGVSHAKEGDGNE